MDFSSISFSAIMVLYESLDWGRDIQICCDILRSQNGVLGSLAPFQHTPHFSQEIPVYFSAPDFIWSNDFPVNRFGQGAFRRCMESAYQELTGHPLKVIQCGKPMPFTYDFAEQTLDQLARKMGGGLRAHGARKMVYAVGDNLASDITGANHYGWKSILVRSGVFKDDGSADQYQLKPNHHIPKDLVELPTFHPSHLEPTILCDDIGEAVERILRSEGA